jgi:transcriptional regulator with XRE-family HTH domain
VDDLTDVLKELIKDKGKQTEIAKKLGISAQRLGQYLIGRQKPKLDFYVKWKQVYGEDIQQMLIEGKTNVSRGTSQQAPQATVNEIKETFYRHLIEENPEYSLLPKVILRDYKMIPEKIIDMIYQNNGDLKAALIDKYERIIKDLEEENDRLLRKLPPDATA